MQPTLYILMRTDLPSMNAGKAMAQASHASNAFVKMAEGDLMHDRAKLVEAWKNETVQGFGTVLVLAADQHQIRLAVNQARDRKLIAGLVLDPTYPYKIQGELALLVPELLDTVQRPLNINPNETITLFRNEMTCGFIFCDKLDDGATSIVDHLKLHP